MSFRRSKLFTPSTYVSFLIWLIEIIKVLQSVQGTWSKFRKGLGLKIKINRQPEWMYKSYSKQHLTPSGVCSHDINWAPQSNCQLHSWLIESSQADASPNEGKASFIQVEIMSSDPSSALSKSYVPTLDNWDISVCWLFRKDWCLTNGCLWYQNSSYIPMWNTSPSLHISHAINCILYNHYCVKSHFLH